MIISRSNFGLQYQPTIDRIISWLIGEFGLNSGFAEKIALFLLVNYLYGNKFNFNSGFRSPELQKQMQVRWDAGIREGLVSRPATNSRHSLTGWLGKPDAHGADISFTNQKWAGQIVSYFDIKWGGNFNSPSEVHFYD